MDDEKRWQDMNADEQAKRITELENRIKALEAKIKATETLEPQLPGVCSGVHLASDALGYISV
jgi:hypothetical protein